MHHLPSPQALLTQGKQQVLNLFLAGCCSVCQRSSPAGLCPSCVRQVRQCQSANSCDRSQPDLTVLAWGNYEGSLRQAIGQLKYDGHTEMARLLGAELGQVWLTQRSTLGPFPRPVAIVPIPLHPAKLQQRGFNQADLLAQWFCRVTQLPLYSQGLLRVQDTQAQHSLSRRDRQRNLAQAFAVAPSQTASLQRFTVWLLDDIFTSGATARSAAQALRHRGIAVGGVCAVARAVIQESAPTAHHLRPKRR